MNYQVLKSMLDILLKTYKCPFCDQVVTENNIDIIGAAGSTLNIDIACQGCNKHSMIKAEVAELNGKDLKITPEKLDSLKKNLSNIKDQYQGKLPSLKQLGIELEVNNETTKIKLSDKNIVELSQKLNHDQTIEDLFSDDSPDNDEKPKK